MAEASKDLMLAILQGMDKELREHRALLVDPVNAAVRVERRLSDHDLRFGRIERRIAEQADDLALMPKSGLSGKFTNQEVQVDRRLGDRDERLRALEPSAAE